VGGIERRTGQINWRRVAQGSRSATGVVNVSVGIHSVGGLQGLGRKRKRLHSARPQADSSVASLQKNPGINAFGIKKKLEKKVVSKEAGKNRAGCIR